MKTFVRYLGVVLATMTLGASEASADERNVSSSQPDALGDRSENTALSPAPSEETDRTLLAGKVHHGGYGAPHVKVTALAGQAGLLVGGRGAWVIGHALTLGGGGYGLPTRVEAPEAARGSATKTALSLGYGGFRIGYILFPHDILHFSGGLLIGAGGVSVLDRSSPSDPRTMRSASVFVLEPEAAMEVNITPTIRGAIDVSYRYMSDSNIPGLSSSAIGGPAAGVTLAFGWF